MDVNLTSKRGHRGVKWRAVVLGGATGVVGTLIGTPLAQASPETWDGGAATNVLNTAANWTNDALPTNALDTATWDGTVAGNLSLVWNATFGPGSGNAGGVNVNVAATNTGSLQLDAVSGNFGLGDITIASGAGALTFGDGIGTANVVVRDPTTAFTNNSSNAATFKSDVVLLNGGGVGNRSIAFDGSGNWVVEGTLISSATPAGFGTSASTAILTKSGTGTLTLSGANAHGGGTTINAGVVSAQASGALGTGAINIPNPGGRLRLSNGITLPNAINLPGDSNVASDTLSHLENVSGNNTIGGAITWNSPGGLFSNIVATSGTLTLNGSITTSLATGPRTLNFTGAGNIVSTGVISNGTAMAIGLSKSGAGTTTLTGANTYTAGTTITLGTLVTGNAAALGAGPVSAIAGTLKVGNGSANQISGLTGLTMSDGTTLSLAGADSAITLASGNYLLGAITLDLNNLFNAPQTYTVINAAVGSTNAIGTVTFLNADTVGYTYSFAVNPGNGNGVLTVAAAVPEPATFGLLGAVAGSFLVRRRGR